MAGNVPNSLLKDEDPEPMDTAPKVKVKKEMVDKKCEKDDNLDKGDRAGQGEEEEEEEEDDEDDEWCEKVISKRKQKTTKTG